MFEIKTPSRVHMTLIDMNGHFGRIDGSVGLALEGGGIHLRAKRSDTVTVTERFGSGPSDTKLCSAAFSKQISDIIAPLLPENEGVGFEFLSPIRPHVGLGSGTQIALSAATAVNDLYSLGKSVRELAKIARRGGTSGIGVLAFEKGGFIVDCGHKKADKDGFLPSSKSTAPPADLMLRMEFPDWDTVIAIPPARGISGEEEKRFFRSVCPVPIEDVREISHIVLMQMLPAIVEQNIEELGKSVNRIQELGFKKYEVEIQPPVVKETAELMLKSGLHGAGVSSFGPAVFGFSEGRRQSEEIREILLEKMPAGSEILITKANNTGAEYYV